MARIIKVTPEELESAATAISGMAEEYKNLYTKLYSETSAMANTWKGEDNLAFIKQIGEFKDCFNDMHELMLQYVNFLRTSAKAYRTTQDNVVEEAQKLVNKV